MPKLAREYLMTGHYHKALGWMVTGMQDSREIIKMMCYHAVKATNLPKFAKEKLYAFITYETRSVNTEQITKPL